LPDAASSRTTSSISATRPDTRPAAVCGDIAVGLSFTAKAASICGRKVSTASKNGSSSSSTRRLASSTTSPTFRRISFRSNWRRILTRGKAGISPPAPASCSRKRRSCSSIPSATSDPRRLSLTQRRRDVGRRILAFAFKSRKTFSAAASTAADSTPVIPAATLPAALPRGCVVPRSNIAWDPARSTTAVR